MDIIKEYLPHLFIGLGMLFSFIGGVLIFVRTNDFNEKIKSQAILNQKLTIENKKLITDNIQMTSLNGELIKKNLELSEQNIELTNQLNLQSESISSNITGGDSYCCIEFSDLNGDQNVILLINKGEYTVHNIHAQFVDLDEIEIINPTIDYFRKNSFHLTELHPKTAKLLGQYDLSEKIDEANFNFRYNAMNGAFNQKLKFRKQDNHWFTATQIKKGDSILYERIDEGFPFKNEREDIWGKIKRQI
ncbi:hypothetical protein ACUNWD_09770 [Sunxiuqinia sp. A32]|uniref:hypothetical protein n=1 Tax=Sunxiuqinia sp. A32 TaxID=3461496 RepID=UPI00404594A0